MHSIGNEQDATFILSWVRSFEYEYGRPICVVDRKAPRGWNFLGNGISRSVWRSPGGVAYKVEHRSGGQSEQEVRKMEELWDKGLPEGCRLPKFQAYYPDDEVVVAVEVIEGETLYHHGEREGPFGDYYELLWRLETTLGLWDMHDDNAMVDQDGYLVPVDLG